MIGKVAFVYLVTMACVVVACGRQVTPNPPGFGAGGAAPGFMTIKYDIAGPLNFSAYQYWVIFNTSGNGLTPLTNTFQTNWAAYSAGTEAAGLNGGTSAWAVQFLKSAQPGPPAFFHVIAPGQQFQYILNSNGLNTEFSMTLQRVVFNPINVTPAPSPTPPPHIWRFNAFVTQASVPNQLLFLDSMGPGGATDTQFSSPQLDINQCFDQVFYKQQDVNPPSDPSAQLVSVQIANNPSPGPSSSPCPSSSP